METIILHPNATPVYGFLSHIHQQPAPQGSSLPKILDCGAGGRIPPLALFAQNGFEAWGIDNAPDQMEKARQFCATYGIQAHLQPGDMRSIPFPDDAFEYVYEHYAMCHLSKVDTATAVREMYRVLKPGGLCFLGVISTDCWPRSFFGEERKLGEYWGEEDGKQNVLHSMFSDEEADTLVSFWKIIAQEKQVHYLREAAEKVSLDEWQGLYGEAEHDCSPEYWQQQYPFRAKEFRYVHLYYILQKLP